MECKKCGAKWETGKIMSESLTVCPFCKESLPKKEEPNFYDNSKDALATIMSKYGAEVLLGRLNAHFPDFAPSVSTGDKQLVYSVYEFGAAQVLKSNLKASQTDKECAVKIAVQKLTKSHIGLDSAETIIYEFAAALGWQVSKPAPLPPPAEKDPISSPNKSTSTVIQPKSQGQSVSTPPPSVSGTNQNVSGIAAKILLSKEKRNLEFGRYKWRVLDMQVDKALLITEDVIEQRKYNESWIGVTWETCTLRKYLNGEFLQRFTEEERRKIVEKWISNPDNPSYRTKGGNDTKDHVFLLSIDEATRFFNNDSDRVAKNQNNEECWWWLRSPGGSSYNAAIVSYVGDVGVGGGIVINYSGGVRPAFLLNLKS